MNLRAAHRALTVTALVILAACGAPPQRGEAVRLVTDASDTLVVNGGYSTPFGVRALDAEGRAVTATPIHYTLPGGDSLAVGKSGAVTCVRSGDFTVDVALAHLARRLVVRCRPVKQVQIPGPLQFILGDTALSRPFAVPLVAYGNNGRPITPIVASMRVKDTSIASLRGPILSPRARGITGLGAQVGDRDAWIGVHVYQRVNDLASLDTLLRVPDRQRLFAVPIRLNAGDLLRRHLPRGDWMLTMLPETDTTSAGRIHLRIEGSRCTDHIFNTPRRWGCSAGPDATVVLYRPPGRSSTRTTTGYLLVRWLFS